MSNGMADYEMSGENSFRVATPISRREFARLGAAGLSLTIAGLESGAAEPNPSTQAPFRINLARLTELGRPGLYAIARFKAILKEHAIEVVEISPSGGPNRRSSAAEADQSAEPSVLIAAGDQADGAVKSLNVTIPMAPESLVIRKRPLARNDGLIVAGRDDRGLMFALLDLAERITWAKDKTKPFSEVRDTVESPDVVERAVSIYTMQKRYFEQRFFDENYWKKYFDLLAAQRFNAFVVVFGYENGGYFAPAYPYFFDVEGFPTVRVVDFSPDQQKKYSVALRRLIDLAHERGLKFTAGLWDHIYRGGVQSGGVKSADPNKLLRWVPAGLTPGNLMEYSAAAFAKFLREFPQIDSVQFRMHNESGLKPGDEMREFWRRMYQVVKETRPQLQFNARAKEFPDELIDLALQMGINLRITTKYWAEQMGLPFHPTHVNRQNQHDRRHGYADLLRYPQRYPMHWRLWNGGTTRLLLWGSPDFARRFAESTHLYDGQGFEINEMLATKMEAQPHDAQPFELLNSRYRYYQYEFERYWHFYQVFGRLAYNPQASPEIWEREFNRRFGADGPHLQKALHQASWILPRINASIFPYHRFPTTRGWVEKQRWEDLPAYAKAEGSDVQQFASFNEAAGSLLGGEFIAKCKPEANSLWFRTTGQAVLSLVKQAESAPAGTGPQPGAEFLSTVTDLRILAYLALYHAERIQAALRYALFKQTQNRDHLDKAVAREKSAIEQWRQLVATAGDVYHSDLMFGLRSAGLCGHWRDELVELEKGLSALVKEQQDFQPDPSKPVVARGPSPSEVGGDLEPPGLEHEPIKSAPAGQPLRIVARVRDASPLHAVRLLYRSVTQFEDYTSLVMRRAQETGLFEATVPGERLNPRWDFMYLFEVIDQFGNGKIYPDFEKETPYIVVKLER